VWTAEVAADDVRPTLSSAREAAGSTASSVWSRAWCRRGRTCLKSALTSSPGSSSGEEWDRACTSTSSGWAGMGGEQGACVLTCRAR